MDRICPSDLIILARNHKKGWKGNVCMKRSLIQLEPDLEELAGHLNAHERVMLAKKFFRWSKQLYVSVRILRRNSGPKPRATLKRLPERLLRLN